MTLIHASKSSLLFDLDGTLADTAPDLSFALNRVREEQNLPPLPLETVRNQVSNGAGALITLGFGFAEDHPNHEPLRQRLLNIYADNIAVHTRLFEGMEELLQYTEARQIPWGVVTNKPSRFTLPLMEQLRLTSRAACIVSGDTLERKKPHPAPLFHACQTIGCEAQHSVYVGDAARDIEAGNAAGMHTIAALFGYIDDLSQTQSWGADTSVSHPEQIRYTLEHWIK